MADIEQVEGRYGPVGNEIVRMALAGQREAAVAKMNDDCRPLLAALLKATSDFIACDREQAALRVKGLRGDLEAEQQLRQRHAGGRVLLAEDNPVNQDVAVTLPQMAGLQVDVAGNGREAVAMATAAHYDAILMDMQMPVLDGPHAARLLREQPATARTPIIAMTANAYSRGRATCLAAGMNDHLTKPVDPLVLYATLLYWLDGHAERAGNGPSGAAPPPAPAAPHPSGIDTARGLAFFAGNQTVYRQTLGRFADLYATGIAALDGYLAQPAPERREALKRELHSLGGASAAVGAVALSEASRQAGELLASASESELLLAALRALQAQVTRQTAAIRPAS